MCIPKTILKNLAGRAYGINERATLAGVKEYDEGKAILKQLVEDGRVDVVRTSFPGTQHSVPMYRLRPTFRVQVAVDNSTKTKDTI